MIFPRLTIVCLLLACVAFIMATACTKKESDRAYRARRAYGYANELSSNIEYFIDKRTGLCFAMHSAGGYHDREFSMSNVDCDKVSHLLLNGDSQSIISPVELPRP